MGQALGRGGADTGLAGRRHRTLKQDATRGHCSTLALCKCVGHTACKTDCWHFPSPFPLPALPWLAPQLYASAVGQALSGAGGLFSRSQSVGITLDGCECWGGLGAGQLGASSACCWLLAAGCLLLPLLDR